MSLLKPAQDSPDIFLAGGELGRGERVLECERAVKVEPPARLRCWLLDAPPGGAPMRTPDGGRFGDRPCCPGPGGDRLCRQAVVDR